MDDDVVAEPLEYECGFCREGVSDDPLWVRIDLRWDNKIHRQQLGAHFACLKAALRPGFPLYDDIE